jgi:hypothetical protein
MTLRGMDPLGGLLAAGHIAAFTLLGVIVHDELAPSRAPRRPASAARGPPPSRAADASTLGGTAYRRGAPSASP